MKKSLLLLLLIFSLKSFSQIPSWGWAKKDIGSDYDYGNAVATDASGNSVVVGFFASPTFFVGSITLNNNSAGYLNMFVVKYNTVGSVLWARTNTVGSGDESAYSVAIDAAGNVFVAGTFTSSTVSFDATHSVTNTNGFADDFLVKYDAAGTVQWAKSCGGTGEEGVASLATDISGNVIMAGYFKSPSMVFTTGTLNGSGFADAFVVKYNSAGTVQWAKKAGGSSNDYASAVTTDLSKNVIVGGYFYSTSIAYNTTTLTNTSTVGFADMYVIKFDSAGTVIWSKVKTSGGTLDDVVYSINSNAAGDILVGGYFDSPSLTFGSTTLTNAGVGNADLLVLKFNSAGTFQWAKSAGGTEIDYVESVDFDNTGNALVAGYFSSASITIIAPALTNAGSGNSDIFVAKYSAAGAPVWSMRAGGPDADFAYGIALDASSGAIVVAGYFASNTIVFGSTTLTNSGTLGMYDMFIGKLNSPIGIEEVAADNLFQMSPNPSKGPITIFNPQLTDKNARVRIYSELGAEVFSEAITSKRQVLDTKLDTGIYFVRVTDGDKVFTRKLIVQ